LEETIFRAAKFVGDTGSKRVEAAKNIKVAALQKKRWLIRREDSGGD